MTCLSNGVQTRRIRGPSSAGVERKEDITQYNNRVHVRQRIAVFRQLWS